MKSIIKSGLIFRTPVYHRGPFTSIKRFEMAFKSTKFIGGAGDVNSFGTEGLAMALNVFDKLKLVLAKELTVSVDSWPLSLSSKSNRNYV